MSTFASFTLLILALKLLSLPIVRAQICNRKSENQMDAALAKLIVFGQKDVRFPENERELRLFCSDISRLWDRVDQYANKCLNKFGRNAYNVLAHSVSGEMRSICKANRVNKRAQLLLDAAICGNIGNDMIYKHCYSHLVSNMTASLDVDVKKRIPICCCNFFDFIRCWESQAEKIRQCTAKARDFFVKWLAKMFEGITQLMCTQYDESNSECDAIIRAVPPLKSTGRRYKSVFLPLVHIAMSLEDDAL